MKYKYEGIIVLNTTGIDENIDAIVQKVGKEIEGEGASLEQIEQMGRKEFAYNARHLSGGHYVNYQFMAESDTLEKVRAKFGGAIVITSGHRPSKVNARIGGSSRSEHLMDAPDTGAVDFYVAGADI